MPKRTLAELQTIIEQQQQSGLTVPVFCEQNALNTKSFYNRRKALRNKANTFVPMVVPSSPQLSIVLEYENAKLHIPANCEPTWVAMLLKACRS
ncbi:IS66 family insertion sequence element accessory protein TnpA [Aestuariibacter salexigens]|uniref:IS66 family insertion sequence element accessory protein TnpA n=1 Tax=Aestuariibacter salexigens TaxID=226010 RepID=UPI00041EFC2D|nr:hypothetical protein [Aestuariibacter salexigens]